MDPKETKSEAAGPMMRFGARMFDVVLETKFVSIIVTTLVKLFGISHENLPLSEEGFLFFLVFALVLPISFFIDGYIYTRFGNSFGKLLFSLRVVDSSGSKLSRDRYTTRNFHVWGWGMGFLMPILSLVALTWQYVRLRNGKTTTYDDKTGDMVVVEGEATLTNTILIVVIFVVLVLL